MKIYSFFLFACLLLLVSNQLKSQTYCIPPKSTYGGPMTGFTNVHIGTLNNTSSNEGYTNYTATVAAVSLKAGSSYIPTFVMYDDAIGMGFTNRLNLRIWIDFNHDFDFDDAGEMVLSMLTPVLTAQYNNNVTGSSFIIPSGAAAVTTRMRVYCDMPEADGHITPVPCGYLNSTNTLGQHGECEDYAVTITLSNSVNEISSSNKSLSIFPNPGKDFVIINLPAIYNPAKIFIYDITGKTAKQFDVMANEQKMKLDVGDLPKGLYFVSVNGYSSKLNVE